MTNKISLSRLGKFFSLIKDEPFFQPHSFDIIEWHDQIDEQGEYWWLEDEYKILAYGFIRGWREGWPEKVIGICSHPNLRGKGFGELMLRWLEKVAWDRGLEYLRIHVDRENKPAYNLYKKLGYQECGQRENDELIMRKEL